MSLALTGLYIEFGWNILFVVAIFAAVILINYGFMISGFSRAITVTLQVSQNGTLIVKPL